MTTSIDPAEITPLHEARSESLLNWLTADMQENGWEGRPLLVIERPSGFLAWTGSHRIAAAKNAKLRSVPCYVIQENALIERGFDSEWGHVEDWERLKILREIGDDQAIYLMWQEGR